jgi:hypothetical protein
MKDEHEQMLRKDPRELFLKGRHLHTEKSGPQLKMQISVWYF